MFSALLVLFLVPFTHMSNIRSTTYRPIFKICYWLFISDFLILIWVGQKPVEKAYIYIGQVATFYYFLFFIFLIPVCGIIETKLAHHKVK